MVLDVSHDLGLAAYHLKKLLQMTPTQCVTRSRQQLNIDVRNPQSAWLIQMSAYAFTLTDHTYVTLWIAHINIMPSYNSLLTLNKPTEKRATLNLLSEDWLIEHGLTSASTQEDTAHAQYTALHQRQYTIHTVTPLRHYFKQQYAHNLSTHMYYLTV